MKIYRKAARALEAFYARFTLPFCVRCLEVTARYHRPDPRADVELLEGQFPGCCHAGAGDVLWVPLSGDDGRFPPELSAEMATARRALEAAPAVPGAYRIRERRTGVVAVGVGCRHLGPAGCRLGDLKGPLCIAYVCEPIRDVLQKTVGPEALGEETGDFAAALRTLRAAVGAGLEEAAAEAAELERRVEEITDRLSLWEAEAGTTLYGTFASSENG